VHFQVEDCRHKHSPQIKVKSRHYYDSTCDEIVVGVVTEVLSPKNERYGEQLAAKIKKSSSRCISYPDDPNFESSLPDVMVCVRVFVQVLQRLLFSKFGMESLISGLLI